MWKSFPRDLEQRINYLLDEAVPNSAKAFQLYKTCQTENLWNESFEKFVLRLNEFCALPRIDRSKSQFDRVLNRPMDSDTYEEFHLNFRTAAIEPTSIRNIASWAHNLMRFNMKVSEDAISITNLEKTLNRITHPTTLDKDLDIEFSDFCEAWKSVVGPSLDSKKRSELDEILIDLRKLDIQSRQAEQQPERPIRVDYIYLTQTEIDWAHAVHRAAFTYDKMPKYPLQKGPDKKSLIEINKIVTLYSLMQLTDREDLIQHRERVRMTLLDRCEDLLKSRAA